MSDTLLSAQRSLIRIAVVALLLVIGASVFARYATRKSANRVGQATFDSYSGELRAEVERVLESRLGSGSGAGTPVCATAFAGIDAATSVAGRRRIFVSALCRELCLRDGHVGGGSAVGFPAAMVLVRHEGGWHVVGFEAPSDAHFDRDMAAIFPPAMRQTVFTEELARTVDARLKELAHERWPTATFLPDSASCLAR